LLEALKRQLTWYEDSLLVFRTSDLVDEFKHLSEGILRGFLRPETRLVEDIKGLCEGTTDVIPYALATYITHEFRRLCDPKPEGSWPLSMHRPKEACGGVALCPFRQFNYFYQDVGRSLADTFQKLDAMILEQRDSLASDSGRLRDPSGFPKTHVMIGFQYAMAGDIIYHSVLFHELGHHLFAAKWMPDKQHAERLYDKLRRDLPADVLLKDVPPKVRDDPDRRAQILDNTARHLLDYFILPWVGELFADAFAVALGGPQYGLAFHNLTGPSERDTTFGQSHPADLLRKHQQWITLREIGWTEDKPVKDAGAPGAVGKDRSVAESFRAVAVEVFSSLRPRSIEDVRWKIVDPSSVIHDEDPVLTVLAAVLIDELHRIAAKAVEVVEDAKVRCSEFWALGPEVMKLFERAVVPSTIVLKQSSLGERAGIDVDGHLDPDGGDKREAWMYWPQPCTVMNVARVLYETGCGKLLKDWPPIQEVGAATPKDKLFRVHGRLSDWTQKAIADWLLYQAHGEHG